MHVEPQRKDEWELFNTSAHCECAGLEAELKDAERVCHDELRGTAVCHPFNRKMDDFFYS